MSEVQGLFGGSWLVIRVPLRVPLKGSLGILQGYRVITITLIRELITLLRTTHEPRSRYKVIWDAFTGFQAALHMRWQMALHVVESSNLPVW